MNSRSSFSIPKRYIMIEENVHCTRDKMARDNTSLSIERRQEIHQHPPKLKVIVLIIGNITFLQYNIIPK